jgi:hypothetical protein
MRKIESMYKLRHRTINIDDLIQDLFLLTPIITVLMIVFLWLVLGTGKD